MMTYLLDGNKASPVPASPLVYRQNNFSVYIGNSGGVHTRYGACKRAKISKLNLYRVSELSGIYSRPVRDRGTRGHVQ